MITVAWGNVLSIIFPGAIVLFALGYLNQRLAWFLRHPNHLGITGGVYLLLLAAIAGGVVDGFRRALFDGIAPRLFSTKKGATTGKNPAAPEPESQNLYEYVTPANLALFEFGVEGSYKYLTFYQNLLCALLFLVAVRLYHHACGPIDLLFLTAAVVLAYAAHLQGEMFTAFREGFIRSEIDRRKRAANAEESAATKDKNQNADRD